MVRTAKTLRMLMEAGGAKRRSQEVREDNKDGKSGG